LVILGGSLSLAPKPLGDTAQVDSVSGRCVWLVVRLKNLSKSILVTASSEGGHAVDLDLESAKTFISALREIVPK